MFADVGWKLQGGRVAFQQTQLVWKQNVAVIWKEDWQSERLAKPQERNCKQTLEPGRTGWKLLIKVRDHYIKGA